MQLVREDVDLPGRRLVAAEDAEKDDDSGARHHASNLSVLATVCERITPTCPFASVHIA
jgi:hypothetical protein